MTRNIKLLLSKSKTRGRLDAKKIRIIAKRLTRSELREFLILLKQTQQQEKVTLEIPIEPNLAGQNLIPIFKKRFKDKELEIIKNKELIGGLRLAVADNVLDLSFKNMFERFYEQDS